MTYKKPAGVTYVQMCMYVDANIYKEQKQESLLYEYIYHICYMLACKSHFFHTWQDYDSFALFAATKIYMRMTDHRQFEPKEGERKLEKIKSVLNYAKLTLYGMKVDYQNQEFNQIVDYSSNRSDAAAFENTFKEQIQEDYLYSIAEYVEDEIKQLPRILKKIIAKTPYSTSKRLSRRLYISCLLTLSASVTFSASNKEKIKRCESKDRDADGLLPAIYDQEKNTSATVWRLNESMKDYVTVLCNIARRELANNINDTHNQALLSEDIIEDIMMSNYNSSVNVYEEN